MSKPTVTLRTPLKSGAGNIIAPAGTYDLLELKTNEDGSRSGTIFSKEHYAASGRGMRVVFRLRRTDKVNA